MTDTKPDIWIDSFLKKFEPKTWSHESKSNKTISPHHHFFGNGDNALEIVVTSAKGHPKYEDNITRNIP